LWVLARTPRDLISIAVEGKVRESFGPTLGEWLSRETPGKRTRWSALCELIGIAADCDRALRYQLVHRTASALLEAQRFHARYAVMLVHSFSAAQEGFSDFQAFARQLGISILTPGQIQSAGSRSGVELFLGWAEGPAVAAGAELAPVVPQIEWIEVETQGQLGLGHGLEFVHRQFGPVAFIEGYRFRRQPGSTIRVRVLGTLPETLHGADWVPVLREIKSSVATFLTPDAQGRSRLRQHTWHGDVQMIINA
jgi:Domain of unknown function (DUF6946)